MIQPLPDPIHLRAGGVSVVLTTDGERLPAVLHWGADLGDLTAADLAELARAGVPAPVPNDLDRPTRAGILAEHAEMSHEIDLEKARADLERVHAAGENDDKAEETAARAWAEARIRAVEHKS